MPTGSDRTEYQRYYYDQHKGELSERRKERYKTDPAYRAKVIEAARIYRTKNVRPKKPREPRSELTITVIVEGKQTTAYTVAVLAEQIGRSVDAINSWVYNGVIPKTPFRSNRGDRMYTEAMILDVKMVIQSHGIVRKNSGAGEEIRALWRRHGVIAL